MRLKVNIEHLQFNDMFTLIIRYTVMKKCWEMEPDNRPSFKELYTTTSQYIEQIAGYLDLGFNPFTEEKCSYHKGGKR